MKIQRTVLQVGGLNWATSAAIVERRLRRRPGWFHPDDRGHRVWADAFWNVPHSPALPAALNGLQRTFMESTPGIVVGVVDSGDDDSGDDIDLHP